MPPHVPRLAYVASIGRSGSTLLELLLGAHASVATIGELHLWPHELREGPHHLPCGCGLPVTDCPFWQEMRTRFDPLTAPSPRLDHFREQHTGGRTLRTNRLPEFTTRTDGPAAEIAEYGRQTAAVLTAFADLTAETAGARPAVVVDSSKDPYRLAWLARSEQLDITVLHMVRDPRGFVYSESKNDGVEGAALARLAVRKAGAWSVQNELVRRAGHLPGVASYRLVRYEDLVSDPGAALASVLGDLGCLPDPALVDTFRDHQFHAIGGNPMRHDHRPISLDEQWRDALPANVQRAVQSLTAPVRRRYGY